MALKLAAEIYRDFETDGVPASGAHQPIKAEIREHLAAIEALTGVAGFSVDTINSGYRADLWRRRLLFTSVL
jgi:hypothetical protein